MYKGTNDIWHPLNIESLTFKDDPGVGENRGSE